MGADISESIRLIQQEKNISEDLVLKTIEETLLAAYKRHFGTNHNAIVQFSDNNRYVHLYAKKTIVDDDDWDDPALHIEISEAKQFSEEAEIGDELLIEVDPHIFDRSDIQTAKQKARQDLRDIQKDVLYSEYKNIKGEVVIGYCKRERNGNLYVDLGSTEGVLPRRFQSPRETYRMEERIKVLIYDVSKTPSGLSLILSRTHAEFVRQILENEVPEIKDGLVEIHKIVREPGYRTKIAVRALRDEIDPVGSCVGPKGSRIQAVVRELEGEKIDVVRYENDPALFIANVLSPAAVDKVFILNSEKKQALAVVDDQQLSLAIGKQGLNVRLANRLADWNIDVKTRSQFAEMDINPEEMHEARALFAESDDEEIETIAELPGVSERLAHLLQENGLELIESLVGMSREDLLALNGLTEDDADTLLAVIRENVEIVETTEDESYHDEEEEYECPECGARITLDMKQCPNCGVDLEFEEED
jgi:N utilization substance protein A